MAKRPLVSLSRPVPALLLVLVFLSATCGLKKDKGEEAEQTAARITHKVVGIVRGGEASWPDDAPGDVPVFSQGRIVAAEKGLTADGTRWTIRLADIEEGALDAYFRSLRDSGWNTSSETVEGGGEGSASKESLSLTLSCQGGQGTLVIKMKMF